jgi:oxygen-dependent protoporphyrinogen oxidase
LLGPFEKLRIFGEPFIRARRDASDESVYDFAARRIGRGAADMFVDPMVSGVYGGVAKNLSLPACFPIMREMELQYGGLVKAMIVRARARKKEARRTGVPRKSGGPAGPGGHLTSFKTGLDVLITRLAERLRPIIKTGQPVASIAFNDGVWEIAGALGHAARAKRVIIACPTYVAAQLFRGFDTELSHAFDAFPYAPIVVVATGHRREDIAHPLDGFGFLIPRNQGLRTLGSIWTSSIFAGRAPEGHIQFRSMLGGAGDPSVTELTDGQLLDTIRRELGPLVGIKAAPVFTRIYRWERGIPQFNLGHIERRAQLEALTAKYPGLHLVGNAFYGVGLNDCVKMAHRVAQEIGAKS